MDTCPICKSDRLVPRESLVPYEFDDTVIKAKARGVRCESCGEGFTSGDEMERVELAVASALAESGVVNGKALRFMRKAIGLPAKDLAALLHVDANTISRWETGDNAPPFAAVAIVGELVVDHLRGRSRMSQRLNDLLREPAKDITIVPVEQLGRMARSTLPPGLASEDSPVDQAKALLKQAQALLEHAR